MTSKGGGGGSNSLTLTIKCGMISCVNCLIVNEGMLVFGRKDPEDTKVRLQFTEFSFAGKI